MKKLNLIVLINLIAALSFAKTEVVKKTTPVKATTNHAIELKFSEADGKVSFLAKGKPAMIKIMGEGTGPAGTLTLENDKLAGTLSIDLTKLTTKIEMRDDHMKNKYLEVSKFPKAEMTFKDVSFKNDTTEMPFQASLNLHGITKPVSGTIQFAKIDKQTAGIAKFTIKVTDFLPELPSYAGIKVADDVEVTVDLKTILQ